MGGERKEEKTQEIRFSGKTIPVERRRGETECFDAPGLRGKNLLSRLLLFLPIQGRQGPGLVARVLHHRCPGLRLGDKPTCPFACVPRGRPKRRSWSEAG